MCGAISPCLKSRYASWLIKLRNNFISYRITDSRWVHVLLTMSHEISNIDTRGAEILCAWSPGPLNFVWWCLIFSAQSFQVLGAFAKLRKATVSCVMSVPPAGRPHGTTWLPLHGFSRNLAFDDFSKSIDKIQVSLKSDKNNGYFTWRSRHIYISLNSS
jgi:hypothetical protein